MERIMKYVCLALLLTQVSATELTEQDQIYIVSGILGGVCLILTIITIINLLNIISLKSEVKKLNINTKSSKVGIDNTGMAPLNEGTRDSIEMRQKPGGGTAPRDPYMAYGNRPASGRPVSQGPSRDPYAYDRYDSSAPPRDQQSRQASRPASRPVMRATSNADYY